MALNEEIVTGRKFRKLIDVANKKWQRISFWNKGSDTEYNDGKDGETKHGAIDGITDSLASTSSRIAASAKALKQVNDNLGGNKLIYEDGKYYIQAGADTASKKQLGSGGIPELVYKAQPASSFSTKVELPANCKKILMFYYTSRGNTQTADAVFTGCKEEWSYIDSTADGLSNGCFRFFLLTDITSGAYITFNNYHAGANYLFLFKLE